MTTQLDTLTNVHATDRAYAAVDQLCSSFPGEPLLTLRAIAEARRALKYAELDAVRFARRNIEHGNGRWRPAHSWAEISRALGRSRGAAWRKWIHKVD
jgi:hypothetical protein